MLSRPGSSSRPINSTASSRPATDGQHDDYMMVVVPPTGARRWATCTTLGHHRDLSQISGSLVDAGGSTGHGIRRQDRAILDDRLAQFTPVVGGEGDWVIVLDDTSKGFRSRWRRRGLAPAAPSGVRIVRSAGVTRTRRLSVEKMDHASPSNGAVKVRVAPPSIALPGVARRLPG